MASAKRIAFKTKNTASKKKSSKNLAKNSAKLKNAAIPKGQVTVGASVPTFKIPGTSGEVSLSGLKGKIAVLYFYPKDATPGCTTEGHDFSRLLSQFKKAGAEVYGVSRDSMKSHEKFREKESYSVDLLSDEDEKICGLFGVIKMKNMYGKQVRGIERSTFVLNASGKLMKEWRRVSVPGHAEEVLEYVKSL